MGDGLTLPAPPPEGVEFSVDGIVWVLTLDDQHTQDLTSFATRNSHWLPSEIGDAVDMAADYIETVNAIGGHNGVDINGILGVNGVIVTPRWSGLFQQLTQAARIAMSGRTILEFVVGAAAQMPALATTLQIGVAAQIFAAVQAGTPLGWAICAALGLGVRLLEPAPDINDHGAVHADRDQPQQWESLLLGQVGTGNQVALLSWHGFFSAQMGGGHGVYANRPTIGDWETWTLINNGDGTVSLRTIDGHYLSAEQGGGRECQADRTTIGDWEKFVIVNLSDGKIALRTYAQGEYVSVHP